jgi:hypothetical protein
MYSNRKDATGAKHSSAQAGSSQPQRLIHEPTARILKLIDDFLKVEGLSGPIETVNMLLVDFISQQNPDEPYESNFVADTVLSATLLNNFIAKLGEERTRMISLINKAN